MKKIWARYVRKARKGEAANDEPEVLEFLSIFQYLLLSYLKSVVDATQCVELIPAVELVWFQYLTKLHSHGGGILAQLKDRRVVGEEKRHDKRYLTPSSSSSQQHLGSVEEWNDDDYDDEGGLFVDQQLPLLSKPLLLGVLVSDVM